VNDWTWKVGVLHGYGEALWQELAGNIRHITKPIMTPQGMALMKPLFEIASTLNGQQFKADDIVVIGVDAREDLAADAERAWSNSGIVPVNGHSRIKVE